MHTLMTIMLDRGKLSEPYSWTSRRHFVQ